MPFDKIAFQAGFGLFVFALLFRLIGIGWGLPNDLRNDSLHPDEPVIWMYSQAIKPTEGKFTVGFYNYGTLYLTLLRITTDMTNAYGGGPQRQDGSDFPKAMANYDLAGRWISVLAGSGMAWILFLFLYRKTHIIGALAGGFAIAIAPGLVVHSRFQTVDVLATFLLTLSLFCASKIEPELEDKQCLKWAILAGVWAGLSAGTKYTGILGLIPLAITLFATLPVLRATYLTLTGLVSALVAFVVATPGAVIQSEAFLRDFKYEAFHTSTGHGLVFAATQSGFLYHIANLFLGFGLLLTILGCGGLIRASLKKHVWAIALLAFAIVYYLLIGRAEVKFLRYIFPLIPALAIGFGWIVGQAHTHPQRRFKSFVYLGIFALAGLGGGGLIDAARMSQWMAGEDPRDASARWIKSQAEIKTVGLVQDPWFYSSSLFPAVAVSRAMPLHRRLELMDQATDPKILLHREPGQAPKNWDVRLATSDQPDAIVMSSFEFDDLERLAIDPHSPPEFQAEVDDYKATIAALKTHYHLIKLWGEDGPTVHDLMYIRPRVWLWQKNQQDSKKTSNGSSTTSVPNEGQVPTP